MSELRFQQIEVGQDSGNIILYGLDSEGKVWLCRNSNGGHWKPVDMNEDEPRTGPPLKAHKPNQRNQYPSGF